MVCHRGTRSGHKIQVSSRRAATIPDHSRASCRLQRNEPDKGDDHSSRNRGNQRKPPNDDADFVRPSPVQLAWKGNVRRCANPPNYRHPDSAPIGPPKIQLLYPAAGASNSSVRIPSADPFLLADHYNGMVRAEWREELKSSPSWGDSRDESFVYRFTIVEGMEESTTGVVAPSGRVSNGRVRAVPMWSSKMFATPASSSMPSPRRLEYTLYQREHVRRIRTRRVGLWSPRSQSEGCKFPDAHPSRGPLPLPTAS